MVTKAGTQSDPLARLVDLAELDFDAVDAYSAAIERVSNPAYKEQFAAFMGDHQRHIKALSEVISDLGGTPPQGGDAKRILTQGKVIMAGLIGDRAVLTAMRSNEDDTNAAYENALTHHNDVSESVISLLHSHLSDERRHRAWLEEQLRIEGSMPSSIV